MKFGLSEPQYQELLKHLVQPLLVCQASVWVFGSRARGDHKPYSDIDIMVESDSDLSSKIGAIREYFSNSNFPIKIDIVEKQNFAESYLKNFEREKIKLG